MDNLDSDKLFDLALQASETNDTRKSIDILKTALQQTPNDARMWYMLGSLYTNIGIYDKAVQNMEKALQVDPNYTIARFHLGLMQLMSGQQEAAETTWLPLDALGESHCLRLFKTGLLKIVDENIDQGIQLIRQGIAANHLVESLNNDMEMVIKNALLTQKELNNGAEPQSSQDPIQQELPL